jgi:ankyrin repeat protein
MLVAACDNINPKSGSRCTALQAACSKDRRERDNNGHIKVVKFLLKSGADVNACGGYYGDALQACVEAGNVKSSLDTLNLLLDHGAEINHQGGIYRSGIWATVSCGNVEAAHVLIDRGVELDDEIFLLAMKNKRKTVIPLLFQKGVNVNAENKDGTVLQMAIENNDIEIIIALLQDPLIDINAQGGKNGETALYCAVGTGNQEVVTLLLDRGADANAACGKGDYCLTQAVGRGDKEMVHLLLERRADINARSTGHHYTALVAACDRENEGLVHLILSHGADVNAWDEEHGEW